MSRSLSGGENILGGDETGNFSEEKGRNKDKEGIHGHTFGEMVVFAL